jgi:hypothetical protein
MSPAPSRVQVQFDGAQHGNVASLIHARDLDSLRSDFLFVDAAGDSVAPGVIGDGNVFVAALGGGIGHLLDGP